MLQFFPIIIFLIYLYGLGAAILKKSYFIEKISLGLSTVPILGVILNALHIPLDWRIFLGLALIMPIHQFIQWWKAGRVVSKFELHLPSWQTLLVLAVFIFALAIYCWGPFNYPWLENDDPWSHAASIKYIAIEKNLNVPSGQFQYLNPYPPGYDLTLGILHQITPSIYWTMKFFNGFFICLGFLFFYIFTEELTKNKSKAALATFFLAMIPCYLTHFIWAHSLAVTLFFPSFYFLLKSFRDRKYVIPAAICCASVALTQPTQTIKFMIMAALLIISFIPAKIKWKNLGLVILIASIASLLWWGPVIFNALSGGSHIALRAGANITGYIGDTAEVTKSLFSPSGGTATQAYSWEHYLFTPEPNLINNPVGLGIMFCLLLLMGIIFSLINLIKTKNNTERAYLLTILLWLIFTFLGMNSMTFNLPIGLFAFRFWMLFAIPVSILCAEGVMSLQKFLSYKWNKILVVGLILFAVARVNLPFKWWFNTSEWTYGVHWASDQDVEGYVWMRENLPVDTKVFSFSDNILVIGHDMQADFWSKDYQEKFDQAFKQPLNQLHQHLTEMGYEFLLISPKDIRKYGREDVNQKIKSLIEDNHFQLIFNNSAVKIFKVK